MKNSFGASKKSILFGLVLGPIIGCSSAKVVDSAVAPSAGISAVSPASSTPPENYASHPAPQQPFFLSPDSYAAIRATVAAPPAPLSKAEILDNGQMVSWQIHRTTEQCAIANDQVYVNLETLFGNLLSKEESARLKDLFSKIHNDAGYFVLKIKTDFDRPRPFLTVPGLDPCVPKEKSKSYPSGHATLANLFAQTLTDLLPNRKQKFLKRAEEVGQNRILSGVHYPSDIQAGKKLATVLHDYFRKSSIYRTEFAHAREELFRLAQ